MTIGSEVKKTNNHQLKLRQFKKKVVDAMMEDGLSLSQIGERLGVKKPTIWTWQNADVNTGEVGPQKKVKAYIEPKDYLRSKSKGGGR